MISSTSDEEDMAEFVFLSEKGLRENNEDFYGNYKDEFFVVADGLGGHAAGEVASKVAVEAALSVYKTSKEQDKSKLLEEIFKRANGGIIDSVNRNPNYSGMGTTLVCAIVQSNEVIFANVGDSSGYIYSNGQLMPITKADRDIMGFLTNALGIQGEVRPQVVKVNLKRGDLILLCTDGLTDFVKAGVIEKILESQIDLKKKAKGLIEVALQFGSTDNITVGLITI